MLNPLDRYVVLVDDTEMPYNAPNSEILERIIVSGRDADHGLVLAGTTADLSSCYSGFIATARKSRCSVLVAVDTLRSSSRSTRVPSEVTPRRRRLRHRRLRSRSAHRRLIAWRESPS
jgi:hypothetical protein